MEEAKFKFRNLEPVNYLKTFNKMAEYSNSKFDTKARPNQLKTFPFSAFPLPQFYYNMEGIFENISKKKIKQENQEQILQKLQQQQFMNKHHKFMDKTIKKIIEDNETQQKALQKYRNRYYSQSQRKLPKLISTTRNQRNQAKPKINTAKGINPDIQQQAQCKTKQQLEEKHLFKDFEEKRKEQQKPKSSHKKKAQKFRKRNQQQVDIFLKTRKDFYENKRTSRQSHQDYDLELNKSNNQNNKDNFLRNIVQLQYRQNDLQKQYASKVQSAIKTFHSNVDDQIQTINTFQF